MEAGSFLAKSEVEVLLAHEAAQILHQTDNIVIGLRSRVAISPLLPTLFALAALTIRP